MNFFYDRAGERHFHGTCWVCLLPWGTFWPLSWVQRHFLPGNRLLDNCEDVQKFHLEAWCRGVRWIKKGSSKILFPNIRTNLDLISWHPSPYLNLDNSKLKNLKCYPGNWSAKGAMLAYIHRLLFKNGLSLKAMEMMKSHLSFWQGLHCHFKF